MAIATQDKFIKYLSPVYIGTSHDFSILKTEFPPSKGWFEKFDIKVDLGYLGFAKEYACKSLSIPHKKAKKNPLTEQLRGAEAFPAAFRQASPASV